MSTGAFFQNRLERQRHDRHFTAAASGQPQRVVAAPLDGDRREVTAARAWIDSNSDTVAEVITDQRLDPIGQIRQQH